MYPLWFVIGFWVLLAVGYVFIAGVTFQLSMAGLEKRHGCYDGKFSCYSDHDFPAFFLGIFWPLGIPLAVGIILAERASRVILNAKEKS